METISLKKRLIVLTNAISITLLLVAAQAQDFFHDDFPMFPEDSDETTLPLDTEFHSEMLLPASEASPPVPLDTSSEPDKQPSPAETPLPAPKVPSSPKSPFIRPENICKRKCAKQCLLRKGSILCNKVCRQKCYHSIYICTHHCAKLMPYSNKSGIKTFLSLLSSI